MMTLITFTQSDNSYPIRALHALEDVKEFLSGKDKHTMSFCRILESMKCCSPFESNHSSDEPRPVVFEDGLNYRAPIWKIIHEVSAKFAPNPAMTEAECADWLQTLLKGAHMYMRFQLVVLQFEKMIEAEKVAGLTLQVDGDKSGKKEKEVLGSVVEALIPKVTEYIEKPV